MHVNDFGRNGEFLSSRFGRCSAGDACSSYHDPAKVALCRKFLRGECVDAKCLLSHKINPEKMPVCAFFLRGSCTVAACPYRHVKVSDDAAVCEAHITGRCTKGTACPLKHVRYCPVFAATGDCPER